MSQVSDESPDACEFFRNYYGYWQRLVRDARKPDIFRENVWKSVSDYSTFDVFRRVFDPWCNDLQGVDDFINASLEFELKTFLHGLLLVEDRLSMAHSLETRVPFLDNDLVDFAVRIPIRHKLNQLGTTSRDFRIDENESGKRRQYEIATNDGKVVLRRAMEALIPREIIEQTKKGFSAKEGFFGA